MIRTLSRNIILVVALMFAAACAKVSAPTGGMRDRTPPVVIESQPVNGARNFRGNRIDIGFDEFVILDNINEKFMVSPPMKEKPRIFTRGKSVRIEYRDELRDSTTYTFYFLDAIRDLNENNILDNYRFAFSTGPVIDSLSVTGNVYTALNLEVPEKTSVLLYRDLNDSAVIKQIPDYISRVDQTGYFRIDNMRGGKYRLFALTDDDNSKTWNRVEEAFGFIDSVITVSPEKNYIPPVKDTSKTETTQNRKLRQSEAASSAAARAALKAELPEQTGDYRLILFNAAKKARYLAGSQRPSMYKLTYILSVPPDTMNFGISITDANADQYFMEKSRLGDTINVWLTDTAVYSRPVLTTVVNYPFTDSLGIDTYKEDTIPMRFLVPKAARNVKRATPKLSIRSNVTGGIMKPGQQLFFTAETPLREPDTSRIRLYEVLEKTRTRIPFRFERDTPGLRKFRLDARLREGSQYLLITDSEAFSNIYDETNDSTALRLTVRETKSYSSLTLDVKNCQGKCIIQLLDRAEKLLVQKMVEGDGRVVFNLLEKGTYRVRAIHDINRDGEWTTGDFLAGRQPEPVSYLPEELEILEGWDATKDFDVSVINQKPRVLRTKSRTTNR
jgi:hypothetical protein